MQALSRSQAWLPELEEMALNECQNSGMASLDDDARKGSSEQTSLAVAVTFGQREAHWQRKCHHFLKCRAHSTNCRSGCSDGTAELLPVPQTRVLGRCSESIDHWLLQGWLGGTSLLLVA
eukprot:3875605-Amphidinium_carterae.1